MLAQRLAALVGEVALALLVVLGAAGIAAGAGAVGPGLVDDLDLDAAFVLGHRLRGRGHRRERGAELDLVIGVGLLLLEHDVALEHLGEVRLQVERRHLQEADGLLQLRRHRQRLTQLELQRLLEHRRGSRRGADRGAREGS